MAKADSRIDPLLFPYEPDSRGRPPAVRWAAAYPRTLAAARHRNVTLAADAALDGRRITRFDGREHTLQTARVSIERAAMTRRQQVLSAIAHPQIAYMLLTLGMLGLVVELWTPGAVAPGVIGGICLLLAFFAFQVLPVNTTGVLLVVLGIALLALEVKVPSFGVLGIGGIVALVAGSVMLTSDVPGVHVSYRLLTPVVLASAGIVFGLGRLAVQAQRLTPTSGVEAMLASVRQR